MVNPVSGSSSGTITSPYSGLMRVNGMASGMDIDGMVSSLMKAEKIPLDKLNQQKQLIQWQRDDYRSMNTSLKDLDTTIFSGVLMQSTFNKKTVTSSDDSKVTASAINATNNISAQITVGNLAKPVTWKTATPSPFTGGSQATLKFTVTDPHLSGTTAPTPKTVSFSIASTDTLDDVISKFNNSNLGVSMFKLSDGSVVMSNNKTGTGASLAVDTNTETFMTNLGFTINSGTVQTDQIGDDANITFNGYSMKESSNTFTVSGVSYTIKAPTNTGETVSISTATDVDTIYNSIKSFVDKYNDVIKTINDKVSEKRNRDFQPLTDDQRSSMTESQITLWESKAKSGMLSNDSILSSGLNKMRQDLYSPVSGTDVGEYTQLSQIGIKTSSDYTEHGKLEINEITLRQKIQEDPQAIYKLFNSSGTTYGTEGIAHRLRDSLSTAMSQVTARAGTTSSIDTQYTLGKQLTDLGTQITDFQSKLSDIENRYYKQFTAMEQAMQQANQQASYFASQFGG